MFPGTLFSLRAILTPQFKPIRSKNEKGGPRQAAETLPTWNGGLQDLLKQPRWSELARETSSRQRRPGGGRPAGHGSPQCRRMSLIARAEIDNFPLFRWGNQMFKAVDKPSSWLGKFFGRKNEFSYLIDKIQKTPFLGTPFKHLEIADFFNDEDFREIVASPQIAIPKVGSDKDLIDALHSRNFKAITFPGTTTDIAEYLKWHADRSAHANRNQKTCEGFGVAMRLQSAPAQSILSQIMHFFASEEFVHAAG